MIITPLFVIFMIIVFVLVFLFMNTIDKRKWLTILVSIILTPLVYFYAFYPMLNIFSSYHHQKYFNSESWVEKPSLRYEMQDAMISTTDFIGKSKEDVTALLGTSEWLSWDESKKTYDANKWNYGLGSEPGAFNTMKACVEITFEANKITTITSYNEEIKFNVKD
jgi:hypothetical protein